MGLVDVYVRDRCLAIDFLQRGLDRSSIVYTGHQREPTETSYVTRVLTNLIKLNSVELCAKFGQERLGRLAIRAVGLAEDGYVEMLAHKWILRVKSPHTNSIIIYDLLRLGLRGGHDVGSKGSCGKRRKKFA